MPWVKKQIIEKLAFSPYPGTLNIRLTKESSAKKVFLENSKGLVVEPQKGYLPGLLFRATLEGLECAVVVPLVPNYPNDVLEVMAPTYLRERLKLVDGGEVAVSVRV